VIDFDSLETGEDGLVTAIVQDVETRDVLMVAAMDRRALALTEATGLAHFWSRSRKRLWKKGETSGHTLAVESITPDCDRDVLLVHARPSGPTCHSGSDTCFGDRRPLSLGAMVDRLTEVVSGRRTSDPAASYTARLLESGDLVARKVLEEAGEVAFALKDEASGGDGARVAEEVADLLYHVVVLIEASGTTPTDVASELDRRMVPTTDA
jgi:phosphoribosyl-AMP cyclohydrolase / phosphoribosyl-ATP pyrophosphohydrolase